MKFHAARFTTGLAAAALLLIAACSSQEGPATQAYTAAESAVAAVREDAARYAAGPLKEAETSLAHLKDQLGNKDYRAVIAGAPGVTASVEKIRAEIASSKSDFEAEWTSLSGEVTQMVDAIQARVDTLSKSRRLPKEVTKEGFEAAKAGFEEMKTTWTSAATSESAGNPLDAVTIAKGVLAKGRELMTQLGMPAA